MTVKGECDDGKRGMWRRKREEMRNDKGRMTEGDVEKTRRILTDR